MKLGIVGCGHMASVMVRRWLDADLIAAADVIAATRTEEEAVTVRRRLGVACGTKASAAVVGRDLVLLAIKPQQVELVLPPLAAAVPREQIWMTVLVGTPRNRLAALLGDRPRFARVMPNTPARVGAGATAVSFDPDLNAHERAQLNRLLGAMGAVFEMPEDQINGFAAVAGSGPAYVFLMMEALQRAAMESGFEAEMARQMAVHVVRGAAALADDDGGDPGHLRRQVTSEGGTTAAALAVLLARQWPSDLVAAIAAAAQRGAELAR